MSAPMSMVWSHGGILLHTFRHASAEHEFAALHVSGSNSERDRVISCTAQRSAEIELISAWSDSLIFE